MALLMTPPPHAETFLADIGWRDAAITPLAGDASFRRYFRVTLADKRAVLMDAPPPHEDPRPFTQIAQWLLQAGFRAPNIIGSDLTTGLVLLEDFGDRRMREALDIAHDHATALYAQCVELLVALHRSATPTLPPYDRAVYQREAALFTEWYCPSIDLRVDEEAFRQAWDTVLAAPLSDPYRVLVLRDYHAENIMLIGDQSNPQLGLLDFQDALIGHPAYDLVSLLQDARREVPQALETEMLTHYRALALPTGDFDAAYSVLGAQRNTKILGIFTRLWKRDNKPHYLGFQARVWRYLERDLTHPALAPVKAWFDANVPPPARAAAWSDYAN